MAGLGSRFRDAGYELPKPLIQIHGVPMYAKATESLPLHNALRLIFILLESQPEFDDLKTDIENRFARFDPIILSVPELTRGQSETVLMAKAYINSEEPLLIHNADTGFDIDPDWINKLEKENPDGALLVFESREPRWSFSKENSDGEVIEVREKIPISHWASTGTYYFARGADFCRLAEARIHKELVEADEFYVAPLYNDLIAEGRTVRNFLIDQLYCFGTPEDLRITLESGYTGH